MDNVKCSFCSEEKKKMIKSPQTGDHICFDCVGGIDEQFSKMTEPPVEQKIIQLRN